MSTVEHAVTPDTPMVVPGIVEAPAPSIFEPVKPNIFEAPKE